MRRNKPWIGNESSCGIGESVTPNAQMSAPVKWQHQVSGFDTVDFGIYVNWNRWRKLERDLSDSKAKAIHSRDDACTIDLGIPNMLCRATGKAPMYAFGLATPRYKLWIAAREEPNTYPNAYASPSAQMLWEHGVESTVRIIRDDIEAIGGDVGRVQISRVDLCADFKLDRGLNEQWLEHHRVSRAKKVSRHLEGGTLQTFHVGKGKAPVQLRIYDKTAEIEHSNKPWMRDYWPSDGKSNVWRVEYQLRREILKQFGINTPNDLLSKAGGLWLNLTSAWFSLRLHDNEHTSRRTLCQFWQAVQQAGEHLAPTVELQRFDTGKRIDLKRLLQQVLGYSKTFAAHRGLYDPDEAFTQLKDEVLKITDTKSFSESVRCKSIQLGIDSKPRSEAMDE